MTPSKRPRGRPREVIDPVRVSISVPGEDYPALARYAERLGLSIPMVLRRAAIFCAKKSTAANGSAQ